MNLNALRYFYKASKYNSLTEASQHLHISQPALTKHIKNLENDFQVQLVNKVGRQIELTELGKEILEEAYLLFEQEKRIETLLTNQVEMSLTIGTTQLNSSFLMTSLLHQSKKESYSLKFITENTTTLYEKLQSHQINYAILPELSTNKNLRKEYVFSDELILVAHPDYCPDKLNQSDLQTYYFIKREQGSLLQKTLEEASLPINYSVEVNGHANALTACELKQGIYLTSYKSVSELIKEKKLKEIVIDNLTFPDRDFYLYWNHTPNNKHFSDFTKKLIELLKKRN